MVRCSSPADGKSTLPQEFPTQWEKLHPTIFLTAANIICTFLSMAAQFHSDVLYIEYSSYGFYSWIENFLCCFLHHCSWTFIHYLLLRQPFIEMLMRFWTVYSSIGVFCLVFLWGWFFFSAGKKCGFVDAFQNLLFIGRLRWILC